MINVMDISHHYGLRPVLSHINFRVPGGKLAVRTGKTSAQIREIIIAARRRQRARFKNKPKIISNVTAASSQQRVFSFP